MRCPSKIGRKKADFKNLAYLYKSHLYNTSHEKSSRRLIKVDFFLQIFFFQLNKIIKKYTCRIFFAWYIFKITIRSLNRHYFLLVNRGC